MRKPHVLTRATILAIAACSPGAGSKESAALDARTGDSPTNVRAIAVHGRDDMVENSAAVMSRSQPDILFTINDSGNEPLLFALDTTGADRGAWRLTGATNVDWEAASPGPCAATVGGLSGTSRGCLYVGDVGDNQEVLPFRVIYRVMVPVAERAGFLGAITPERVAFRYPDGPHDVEAMYVAPTGATYLITKRRRTGATGELRPALVFMIPASTWGADSVTVAAFVDSLPIVPGSAPERTITDAALSPDGRRLAVRTYAEIYVFASDSLTGRVLTGQPPAICNIATLERGYGEGITWFGTNSELLLTREGRNAPMLVVRCPMPESDSRVAR